MKVFWIIASVILACQASFWIHVYGGLFPPKTPPQTTNPFHADRQMRRYLKAQGIDKINMANIFHDGTWEIDVSNSKIDNLEWTHGIALAHLYINSTQIYDFSPLTNQVKLSLLHANNTQVRDLKPLSFLPLLQELEIENTQVMDLSPIKNSNIMRLYIRGIPCDDLSEVPTNRLKHVSFTTSPHKKWAGVNRVRSKPKISINQWVSPKYGWMNFDEVYGPYTNETSVVGKQTMENEL